MPACIPAFIHVSLPDGNSRPSPQDAGAQKRKNEQRRGPASSHGVQQSAINNVQYASRIKRSNNQLSTTSGSQRGQAQRTIQNSQARFISPRPILCASSPSSLMVIEPFVQTRSKPKHFEAKRTAICPSDSDSFSDVAPARLVAGTIFLPDHSAANLRNKNQ